MKSSSCSLLPRSLRIAFLLAALPLATSPAQAENPFKVIGVKAKQGLTKVKQAVNPRRIGAALKNAGNAAAESTARIRAGQTNDTDHYPGPVPQYGDPYYYDTPSNRRLELSRSKPLAQSPAVPLVRENSAATDYYTAARYQTLPTRVQDPDVSAAAAALQRRPLLNPAPSRNATAFENPESSPPMSPPLTSPAAAPDPRQENSRQDPSSPPVESSAIPPVSAAQTLPGKPANQPASAPARPLPPRQDLPFGELVPGKPGFAYSPWSPKALVDVSGIPTGTKVKCPYTSKTFRVP